MQLQFSTETLPDRDRFDSWHQTISTAIGVSGQPARDAAEPFRADLTMQSVGRLANFKVAADSHRVVRKSHGIARKQWDSYFIYREAGAGAWFNQAGREIVSHTGDLVIYDGDIAFETLPIERFELELWIMPKTVLDRHLPAIGRPLAVVLSGRNGADALAAGYLETMTRNREFISETIMEPVTDTLARLIGIACGMAAEAQPEAVRAGRLTEAKRYIDWHLTDPDLSPAKVAAALGISVRALHLLFEPAGGSFARTVLRRRLDECRAALLANHARPVTDIAFAWGFGSLSGFYRAFQAAFGLTPGDLRAASLAAAR
jgi:AraC-like DNA-binding protein